MTLSTVRYNNNGRRWRVKVGVAGCWGSQAGSKPLETQGKYSYSPDSRNGEPPVVSGNPCWNSPPTCIVHARGTAFGLPDSRINFLFVLASTHLFEILNAWLCLFFYAMCGVCYSPVCSLSTWAISCGVFSNIFWKMYIARIIKIKKTVVSFWLNVFHYLVTLSRKSALPFSVKKGQDLRDFHLLIRRWPQRSP